jgi:hypothetical protein
MISLSSANTLPLKCIATVLAIYFLNAQHPETENDPRFVKENKPHNFSGTLGDFFFLD